MKYTIKVNEVNKESNIKTMATVVFDDSFKVGSIAVVERNDGELFVAMPQFRSSSKDKYGNDVYKVSAIQSQRSFGRNCLTTSLTLIRVSRKKGRWKQEMEKRYSLRYPSFRLREQAAT